MSTRSNHLRNRLARASRSRRPLLKPKSAAELFEGKRLYAVVVMNNDGSEILHKPIIIPAVSAAQALGGLISSLAASGAFAEAREIDLRSLKFTGRTLGADALRREGGAV